MAFLADSEQEEARMGGKSSSPPTANFSPPTARKVTARLEKLAAARKVSRGTNFSALLATSVEAFYVNYIVNIYEACGVL